MLVIGRVDKTQLRLLSIEQAYCIVAVRLQHEHLDLWSLLWQCNYWTGLTQNYLAEQYNCIHQLVCSFPQHIIHLLQLDDRAVPWLHLHG